MSEYPPIDEREPVTAEELAARADVAGWGVALYLEGYVAKGKTLGPSTPNMREAWRGTIAQAIAVSHWFRGSKICWVGTLETPA